MKSAPLLLAAALAITPTANAAAENAAPASAQRAPAALTPQMTEEGQSVVLDAYTWQRRELAKRLPLSETWPAEDDMRAQFRRFRLDRPPMPEFIPTPAQIVPGVYLVHSNPTLTYLIDAGPDGLVLVDPGLESNVEEILRNVETLGFSRTAIKWVLNTHAHFDHSMADAHFQQLGAQILVGRADAAAVEKATGVTARLVLPPAVQAHYPTLHVDRMLDDGEEIILGNKTFTAISTPGHTEGSMCFLLVLNGKNILFGGDTILFDYRLGAQGSPFSNNDAYLVSLRKLEMITTWYRWDILLPGHGAIVLDRAYLDVLKGRRQVQLDVETGETIDALPFGDAYYRAFMFGRP